MGGSEAILKHMSNDKPFLSRRKLLISGAGTAMTALSGCSVLGGQSGPSSTDAQPRSTWTTSASRTPTEQRIKRSSNFGDLQAVLDAANPGDTVMVDTDHQVADRQPASIEVPVSDIKIEGDGTSVIEAASPNPTGDILRIENKENIWVDNLIIDARCGESDGKARNIGGQEVGTLNNIRVTNCVCKNSGRNAINFVNDNTAGDLADFYIANNTVNFASGHGILLGVYDNAGSVRIENVIYENNTVMDTDSQALGIFAVGNNALGSSVLFFNNTIKQPKSTDQYGANAGFETEISNAAYYGNEIINGSGTLQGGLTVTKGGEQCIVANNNVRNGGRLMLVMDRQPYSGSPPLDNLVIENDVADGNHGLYTEELEGRLQASDNRMRNVNNNITEKNNTGGSYVFYNNGPDVPTSDAGVPDSFENPATWENQDGKTVGAVSWNPGTPHPDAPVRVAVSVDLDGGASVSDLS
jgi:hypothetical protein